MLCSGYYLEQVVSQAEGLSMFFLQVFSECHVLGMKLQIQTLEDPSVFLLLVQVIWYYFLGHISVVQKHVFGVFCDFSPTPFMFEENSPECL